MLPLVVAVAVSGEHSRCCVGASCLRRGEVVVFVGESVARYQYLDLVFGLRGKDDALRRQVRNPVEEGTWPGGWPDFFANTSAELAPYERCDCHRGVYETMLENRVYTDHHCNISVAYIQARTPYRAMHRVTSRKRHLD